MVCFKPIEQEGLPKLFKPRTTNHVSQEISSGLESCHLIRNVDILHASIDKLDTHLNSNLFLVKGNVSEVFILNIPQAKKQITETF